MTFGTYLKQATPRGVLIAVAKMTGMILAVIAFYLYLVLFMSL